MHLVGFIIEILNVGMIKVDGSWKLILAIHLGLCQMCILTNTIVTVLCLCEVRRQIA